MKPIDLGATDRFRRIEDAGAASYWSSLVPSRCRGGSLRMGQSMPTARAVYSVGLLGRTGTLFPRPGGSEHRRSGLPRMTVKI
jgi:hypothetical protein